MVSLRSINFYKIDRSTQKLTTGSIHYFDIRYSIFDILRFALLRVPRRAPFIFIFYEIRLKRLVEIERTRIKIAGNLHDDVGGALSSIQYFAKALGRDKIEPDQKEKFTNLIIECTTDAQDKIKDIIWTVNPEEDDLEKFIIKFNRYASDLLEYEGSVSPAETEAVGHRGANSGVFDQLGNERHTGNIGIGFVHIDRWRDKIVFEHQQAVNCFLHTRCAK